MLVFKGHVAFNFTQKLTVPPYGKFMYDQTLADLDVASGSTRTEVRDTVGFASASVPEGTRYLQPGTWADEYKIYQCNRLTKGMEPASWTVWWRTWPATYFSSAATHLH